METKTIKILNLYAGIGGNRKLWGGDIKVVAVEINPKIAKIYQDFFPQDKVIVTDAHQFLLEHFKEFDFIWSSPPCPSHSRIRFLKQNQNAKPKFPDMELYGEIIFLMTWFDGKFCIENVKSYYEPLIKPQESGNHYFWTNFRIGKLEKRKRGIVHMKHKDSVIYHQKYLGFDLSNLNESQSFKEQILNNCVEPELGLHIFKLAFKEPQLTLTELNQKNISSPKHKGMGIRNGRVI